MNQKITAINIADALATQLTFPKKVTDLFMHAFTDTILEGLDSDGIVKVKGLGTFRIMSQGGGQEDEERSKGKKSSHNLAITRCNA